MMNKRIKKYLGLLIIVLTLVVLIANVLRSKDTKKIIEEVTPRCGSIHTFISTTGTVQPQNRLEVKPPISGRVEQILVKEGQKVEIGQTLAWMSSTERAALLDSARAQGGDVLAYWEQAYKPTPLLASIEGVVIVRAVEPGQTVTGDTAVIVLSDRLIVKAYVDETDIGKVKIGQKAVITLDAYSHIKVDGKVDHISYESTVSNNVTIYEVDILPCSVPDVFRSGMNATVDIIEAGKTDILVIPLKAIKQDREGVFVNLEQGKLKKHVRRKIEIGISDEENVEVVSGIDIDDKILIISEQSSKSNSKYRKTKSNPFMPFGRKKRR